VYGISVTAENLERKSPEKENQVEVFFFPDESNPSTINEMLRGEGGTVTGCAENHKMDYDDGDEDFCILGEEAGVGIMPRHGVPEVRWLCQESVRIVDNHFAIPLGKTDLLKAPKNFPPAILRYTLCEMSLVWHIYGGKDFGKSEPAMKKHITIDDNSSNYVGYVQGR
jgi:autophagy-related protein 2